MLSHTTELGKPWSTSRQSIKLISIIERSFRRCGYNMHIFNHGSLSSHILCSFFVDCFPLCKKHYSQLSSYVNMIPYKMCGSVYVVLTIIGIYYMSIIEHISNGIIWQLSDSSMVDRSASTLFKVSDLDAEHGTRHWHKSGSKWKCAMLRILALTCYQPLGSPHLMRVCMSVSYSHTKSTITLYCAVIALW